MTVGVDCVDVDSGLPARDSTYNKIAKTIINYTTHSSPFIIYNRRPSTPYFKNTHIKPTKSVHYNISQIHHNNTIIYKHNHHKINELV